MMITEAMAISRQMRPENPWIALEQSAVLRHVCAGWRGRLGDWFVPFQAAGFLQSTPELAESYPCPRDCGCVHEVVREARDRFVAVCRCDPWNCDDFVVGLEELRVWELAWSALGRALCGCLQLDARAARLPLPRTRQIGSWSAAAVPVLLTLPTHPEGLRQVLAELAARLRGPYILLTPTTRFVTASCLELLSGAGAALFDLASHVTLQPGGALRALSVPGELFRQFTPQPAETDQTVVERAFALVKALDSQQALRPPTVLAVFCEYCLEGATVSRIARKFCCSRGTVLNRLDMIRRRTGADPDQFRRLSPQIGSMENRLRDPRARTIYRKGALYGENTDDSAAE